MIKVKKRNNEINEKEKSINFLIISIIISFLKLSQFRNNSTIEINTKDLSEILNFHHKIFLLLCFDFLLENNSIRNNINNNFILDHIKRYLPSEIYTLENNFLIYKELKAYNKLFYSILNSMIPDNIEKHSNIAILNNLNNIFILNSKQLIELFKNLYNLKQNENNINKILDSIKNEHTIKPSFHYRNKKIIKRKYLIDEKQFHKASENISLNNYDHGSNYVSNNSIIKNKNTFNSPNQTYYKLKNENEKMFENSYIIKKIQNLKNSSSCKVLPFSSPSFIIEENKKLDIKNINETIKINKISTDLLSRPNNNKPKPPFLTQKISYSIINKKNFTLILDLDETLIKYQISDNFNNNGKIIFRPGLIKFLNKIFPFFDLIIWTIATQSYADKIIDNIEKEKKYFSARLYRDHASYKNKIYIKDLSNLGRPLDKIIIIDDKESNFSLQRDNGILIRPFHGSKWECQNDYVLMDLYNILTKIIFDRSKDVRIGINKCKKDIFQKISCMNKENSEYNRNNYT